MKVWKEESVQSAEKYEYVGFVFFVFSSNGKE